MYAGRAHFLYLIFCPLIFCLCSSCENHTIDDEVVNADSSYFSVKTFAQDQIRLYYGQPISLYRIRHLDGATDSSIVNFYNMDWAEIFRAFLPTDISAKKFLGKYDFSIADDALTSSRGYTYTAKDKDLYTRTFQINTDPYNNRIKSVYIEAREAGFWRSTSSKLLYIPLNVIQIQQVSKRLFRKARSLRIEYKAMGSDDDDENLSK